ncbi:lipopolysaccharide biosynthesis protein [Porphyrobacter sp. AAP60]|uniref:lipopolysaccharide biosynthesis protein n=1 Tax=Porphyrobacter sp. AAP60 TaxID=1523423 RepID=UPI0006B8D0C1|nr:lipopolysaccharide biosynthesis protein [Porphyrobacter sp. AAP60]KPF63275.1 hypothetical protein IP79_10320 [Porphyrobacter sp. AAP60]
MLVRLVHIAISQKHDVAVGSYVAVTRPTDKRLPNGAPQPALSPFDTSHLEGTVGRRAFGGAVITLGASAALFAIQILQLAVLSRLLTPEDFGLVGMAMVATMFVRLFSDVGLPMATVQREEINQDYVSAVFYIDMLASLALTAVCILLAPFASMVFSEPRVTLVIVAIAFTFPLGALRGQHQALLTRRMKFLRLNLVNVSANATGAATAILCAWKGGIGYWSIVAGLVVNSLTAMVLSWIASPWKPSRLRSLTQASSALRFGLNLLGANLASWLWKQADRALIGWRWDATELGHYTRSYSVLMVPIGLISGPISSAVIPALSRLQNDKPRWTSHMLRVARALAFLSALLTLVLALNARFVIEFVLGSQWGESVTIFTLLSLSLFPSFVWEHARLVFISLGRTDAMRRYAVAAAVIHVIAFAIGVTWGPVGVAMSLALASALVTPPLLVVVARVGAVPLAKLAAQFAPSLVSMPLVWGLIHLASPYLAQDLLIVETVIKSAAITGLFVIAHIILLPLHAGCREDARAIAALAAHLFVRKRCS